MSGTLRISEIFASIQGEGIWAGVPSTFIRVSGCNLRCVWCDTPYASWDPEGPVLSVDAILGQVAATQHVVLTGGEPMLFDAIETLAAALKNRGHVITVETAGTIFREMPCDLMSISPKLSHSAPSESSGWRQRHEVTRLNFGALSALIERYPFQLKFVLSDEKSRDLQEIDDLLTKLPPVAPDRVLLMAEGRDSEVLHARERNLVPICMERGWRLTPRLQIDLFGDTRGT